MTTKEPGSESNEAARAPEAASPESAVHNHGWIGDVLRILLVWGGVLLLTLPLFWIARQRAPLWTEEIKGRDPRMQQVRIEAYYARGKLRFLEQKYNEAAFYLTRAKNEDPTQADVWYYLGMIQRLKGESEAAAEHFEECLRQDSNHALARLELAQLLAEQGKTYPAAQHLLTLEDLLAEDSPVRAEENLEGQLIPLVDVLLQDNAEHPQALLLLGREAVRNQDWDEAERLYGRVLESYPGNRAALMGRVEVAEEQDDPMLVLRRLVDLVEQYPHWIALYDRLQQYQEQVGSLQGSMAAGIFEQLGQLRPEARVTGPERFGTRLVGFDLVPRPTILLNVFDVQLHWRQEQGLVWESERTRSFFRLTENLFAHENRLFEVLTRNLIPNPGFECAEPGTHFPGEWPGSFYQKKEELSPGWVQTIEEDLPSQRINRYVRLDGSKLSVPSSVGLGSRRFLVQPNQHYLFGLRTRSRGGDPVVQVRWHGGWQTDVSVDRQRVPVRTTDWDLFALPVKSPPDSDSCSIILINRSSEGIVDFDDVFMVLLEGVE